MKKQVIGHKSAVLHYTFPSQLPIYNISFLLVPFTSL